MGLDLRIYIRVEPTPENLERVTAIVKDAALPGKVFAEGEYIGQPGPGEVADHITVSSWMRYFSPGYKRGDWPLYRRVIDALRAAFPGVAVEYGHDCMEDPHGIPVDDAFLAERDAAWHQLREA